MVLLLALIWVPMTAHCEIKAVPGLEFLQCHCDDANPVASCGDNECCAFETGACQPAQTHILLCPVVDLADFLAEFSLLRDEVATLKPTVPSLPVPELAKPWQLLCRAALPARAPSSAS